MAAGSVIWEEEPKMPGFYFNYSSLTDIGDRVPGHLARTGPGRVIGIRTGRCIDGAARLSKWSTKREVICIGAGVGSQVDKGTPFISEKSKTRIQCTAASVEREKQVTSAALRVAQVVGSTAAARAIVGQVAASVLGASCTRTGLRARLRPKGSAAVSTTIEENTESTSRIHSRIW